ncbi:MAG: hypothetical protein P1P76_02775 [Anaerolineales bacterium]|nr:hypothetical protein [Anaerolineales bacterium]
MDFGAILTRSWEITWKHKGFWVLGILAGCASGGSGGGGGRSGSGLNYQFSGEQFPELSRTLETIPEGTWIAIAIGVFFVLLLLALLFWVLGALGQSGLIAGFQAANAGEEVTLSSAFQMGTKFFWKLLVIQIIVGVVTLILIGGLLLFGIGGTVLTLGLGLLCLLPLICILIPIGIAIGVYTTFTKVALVIEDLDILAAFKRAWEVIRDHPGDVIVMSLILLIGGGVVSFVLALPFILVALPFILGAVVGSDAGLTVGIFTGLLCTVSYLPILIVLNGILQTFLYGSWTLTYIHLTAESEPSKEK